MADRRRCLVKLIFVFLLSASYPGFGQQQLDTATVVRGVDNSVKNRIDRLGAYTVTEHYAVFRGKDETHPAAEMLVKTTYRRGSGKKL